MTDRAEAMRSRTKRWNALLVEVAIEPALRITELRERLEYTHNLPVSATRLRADLALLEEAGLVRLTDGLVAPTERGRDIATGRAPLPELDY